MLLLLLLPRTTHNRYLNIIGNTMQPVLSFAKRFVIFFSNALKSKNVIVSSLARNACTAKSSMGANYRYICYSSCFNFNMFKNYSNDRLWSIFYKNCVGLHPGLNRPIHEVAISPAHLAASIRPDKQHRWYYEQTYKSI